MKKILVPTDFSPTAKAGLESALQISTNAKSEIFVLNIYQVVANNYSADVSLLMQQEIEKKRAASLIQFTSSIKGLSPKDIQIKPKIHRVIKCGNVVNEIVGFSEENDVDLIVIGTKAKHNVLEYIFGSVSTSLIKKSKIPILIVPEGLQFENPKNIAFANDFITDDPSLNYLDEFAETFGASVQQVHVNILPSDFSDLREEVLETDDNFVKKKDFFESTTIIRDKSVKRGLDYFIETHNIDLLALYLPQRTFTEDILHRSLSKQFVMSSKIPILIFKE